MEKTHFVDASVYELPKCGHSDMSYFDVRGNTLADEDGAGELAKMLREIDEGERYAEFYYEGNDIKDWLGKNIREVYAMLGGVGGVSYSTKRVDNEIHLTVKGDFSGEVSVEPEKTPDGDVTDAPTQKPTEAPTEKPTEVITDKTYEKHSEGDADNGLGVDAIEKIVGGCNLSVSTGAVIVTTMCAGVLVASRKKKQ